METNYELSEEDRNAMAAADAARVAHERAEDAKRQAVLQEIQRIVTAEVYAEILDELKECSYTYDYEIAASAIGEEQDQGAAWGNTFVNQTTNGGHTGDEYAGTVSIPLGSGRFFQFCYSM